MERNNEKAIAEVNPDALPLPVPAIVLENRVGGINGGINNDVRCISVSGYVYCIQRLLSIASFVFSDCRRPPLKRLPPL